MLAKIIKIANIKKQREFIMEQLLELSETNDDGDISYLYTGYLFPEVRSYFETEGFKIEDFFNETTAPSARFRTHHLFTISDELKLDDNDWNDAENFNYSTEDYSSDSEDESSSFYNMLEGLLSKGIHPGSGPHLVAIPVPDDIRDPEEIKDFLSNIFGADVVSATLKEKEDSENSEENDEDNIFDLFSDRPNETCGNEVPDEVSEDDIIPENSAPKKITGDEDCYEDENSKDYAEVFKHVSVIGRIARQKELEESLNNNCEDTPENSEDIDDSYEDNP